MGKRGEVKRLSGCEETRGRTEQLSTFSIIEEKSLHSSCKFLLQNVRAFVRIISGVTERERVRESRSSR